MTQGRLEILLRPARTGPGHAETRAVDGYAFGFYEVSKNAGQAVALLAHVVFFHHALQPVAFGLECGQPSARGTDLTRKNHCSTRIMVQFSSTGGHPVPAADQPPLAPSCRMHSSETCAGAGLSTRPIPDPPPSIRLRPYRRAEKEWRPRSCSHTTKPRSRCKRPLRNIWNTRNSCRPTRPATGARESSPQSSVKFLLLAGSE